jgi:hypothetical protein
VSNKITICVIHVILLLERLHISAIVRAKTNKAMKIPTTFPSREVPKAVEINQVVAERASNLKHPNNQLDLYFPAIERHVRGVGMH